MGIQDKLLYLISLLIIVFETYHQFFYASIAFRGYVYTSTWLLCCFVLRPNMINVKILFPFVLFYMTAFIYKERGGEYHNLATSTQLQLLLLYFIVPPLLFFHYRKYVTVKLWLCCMAVLFLLSVYTLFVTIPYAKENPELIRIMAVDHELGQRMSVLGIMSYAMSHGVVFIIPALCYIIRYSSTIYFRILAMLIIVEAFSVIYFSGATTPLILGLSFFIISFVYNRDRKLSYNLFVIISICAIAMIVANKDILHSIIGIITPIFQGTPFEVKLLEFEQSIETGELLGTDIEARQDKFSMTMNAFLSNPFFGSAVVNVGNHNYFFDLMASVGVLGFLPLVIYLVVVTKQIAHYLPKEQSPFFYMGILSFIMMGCMKNIFGMEFYLMAFFVLPSILYLSYKEKKELG